MFADTRSAVADGRVYTRVRELRIQLTLRPWPIADPADEALLEGRCSHQINDAASCKLSAARKECLSSNCVAKITT